MVGLIVGTLAAGSSLLVLMTWLESTLLQSLSPADEKREVLSSARAEVAARDTP